jgi:hypothetical protein
VPAPIFSFESNAGAGEKIQITWMDVAFQFIVFFIITHKQKNKKEKKKKKKKGKRNYFALIFLLNAM